MNIDELEHFTVEELQNFTLEDLEKSPDILKREIEKFGSKIPYDVYIKICKLCDDVNAIPDFKQSKKLKKPNNSVKDVLDTLIKLIQLAKAYPFLKDLCEDFFNWLWNFTNHNF